MAIRFDVNSQEQRHEALVSYIVFFARGTLLVVFVAAIFGKLRGRAAWLSFVAATGELLHVRGLRSLPAVLAVTVESGTAVCLSIDETAYAGLVLALLVLAVFLALVVSGVIRGVRTACNCFGSDGTTIGWAHVWRNSTLTAIAAIGTLAGARTQMPALLTNASYATAGVLSLIFAAVFVRWDDFTDLVLGPQFSDDLTHR